MGYSSEKQISLFKSIGTGLRAELRVEKLRTRLAQIFQIFLLASALYLTLFLFQRWRKTPENLYRNTKELLVKEKLVPRDALPEEIISTLKNTDLHKHVKFIISIYQRYRYSPYKLYSDEIEEGYRMLKKLKDLIRSSRRSEPL